MNRSGKETTPAFAIPVVVPPSVAPPVPVPSVISTLMPPVNPVATLPNASIAVTVTLNSSPAVTFSGGCTANASCVASLGETVLLNGPAVSASPLIAIVTMSVPDSVGVYLAVYVPLPLSKTSADAVLAPVTLTTTKSPPATRSLPQASVASTSIVVTLPAFPLGTVALLRPASASPGPTVTCCDSA